MFLKNNNLYIKSEVRLIYFYLLRSEYLLLYLLFMYHKSIRIVKGIVWCQLPIVRYGHVICYLYIFFICFPFIMCPQEWTQGGTGVFLWFSDITESLVYINVWYTYRSELSLSIKEHLQLPISSIPHLY